MISTPGRLLEREHELERIIASLGRAAGGDGALVVIEGPAGIGKTRVARAAGQEAQARGFMVLTARGAELELDYPFGVVRQLLEPPLREASSADHERLLGGASELAAPVVLPELATGSDPPDPAFGVLHGLYWLCANIADQQPVLLVVDDLQWTDRQSIRFLGFLAHRLEALPILVLVTQRTGFENSHDLLAVQSIVERLVLKPLSADAVASLLRVRVDGDVDDEFAAACHAATDGNPFLLTQVLEGLLEHGVSFSAENIDQIQSIGPDAVATGVVGRLSRLAPTERDLARASAVLGEDTQLALAAELTGIDESSAAAAAAALARAGFLEDSRPLRFEHPLVRSAVEASLSGAERVDLHFRAAQLLAAHGRSPEEVAIHLLATDPRNNTWVADTLAEAARRAVARGAPDAAVPLLTRALAEPPAADERWRLLLELGEAEGALGQPQAAEHLESAHRLAPSPIEGARCALALAWSSQRAHMGGGQSIFALMEAAIEAAGDDDREVVLELESARAMTLAVDPTRDPDARARLESFAQLPGRTRAECALLAQLASYRMESGAPVSEAAELAERALANDDLVAAVGFDGPWLMPAVLVLRQTEGYPTAVRALDHALAVAQRRGAMLGFALACSLRASVLLLRGDVREAEADARAGLDASPAGMWSWLPCLAMLIETLIERDARDEAYELLVARAAVDELPDIRAATTLLLSRSALWAERGDHERTLADLDLARVKLDRYGKQNVVGLDGRLRAALARHALGDDEEAIRDVHTAVDIARRWGAPGAIGVALRANGLIVGGAEGLELHREAVAALGRSARRLELARALVDLGAALRRDGSRAAAREPLREGMALAAECGGVAVQERAREELAATGIRVRRDVAFGVDSLTPSERRIVERAAAGMSNRDIAQSLFVTVKTVEMHLGHAYRKLEIRSRAELAPLLAGQPATGEPAT